MSSARPGTAARWRAYLAERFPVPVTLMLAVATAGAAMAVAQVPLARAGAPLLVDASAWGSGIALVFLLLFHLRVFDEHKDYAHDAATRPDRPVQRGLVTLGELKVAGAVVIAAELAIALVAGWPAGLWWLLPLGWSLLMLIEFGAPRWLARHYALYAISHSAVTPAMAVAIVLLAAPWAAVAWPHVAVLAALGLASTWAIDVLRKTWAPASEIDGVDSWSKLVGIRRAAALGAALIAVAGACAAYLGWAVGGRWGWLGFVAAVTGWGVVTLRGFVADPTPAREKLLQVVAGVHYLAVWIGIPVVAAIDRGVEAFL